MTIDPFECNFHTKSKWDSDCESFKISNYNGKKYLNSDPFMVICIKVNTSKVQQKSNKQ